MKPTDSFRCFLDGIYPAERVKGMLQQLEGAQVSVGFETMVGELAEMQQDPAYHLVIRQPDRPTRVETLGIGEYLIGRAPSCLVVLNHCCVSRVHCLVTVHSDGRVTLRDLHSSNGTIVNGLLLAPDGRRVLQINDQITLCGITLTLVKM